MHGKMDKRNLHNAVAVVVYEAEVAALVGDGQRELIVVHKTHLWPWWW